MPNKFNLGDRVVIRSSILPYMIGRRGTVVKYDSDNNYEIELDEPMILPDHTTGSVYLRWFGQSRLALLDPLEEKDFSIEFSFDSLIGE